MPPKPDIETKWGGTHADHPALITTPASHAYDLSLTSRVLVQGFFSTSRHQYHYVAENGTSIRPHLLADVSVDWNGWKWQVPPTRPNLHNISSFFSPQLVRAAASANVIVVKSTGPVNMRHVLGETANMYLPWLRPQLWRGLVKVIGGLLKGGGKAALESDGSGLEALSSVTQRRRFYTYELMLKNSSQQHIDVESGIPYAAGSLSASLPVGSVRTLTFDATDEPGEVWASVSVMSGGVLSVVPLSLIVPMPSSHP